MTTSLIAKKPAFISKEVMVSILQQMGYLTKVFDHMEQNLFAEVWQLLAHKNWVTLQNLTTLLTAIDKIYIKEKS